MAKVTMPQLGESVAEGTIGKWLKKPGDKVAKYEPLLEVITDKVNAEVPSPYAGVLTEILVEEGATVPNAAEIAVIETSDDAQPAAASAAPAPAAAQAPAAAPAQVPESAVPSQGANGAASSAPPPAPAPATPAFAPPAAAAPAVAPAYASAVPTATAEPIPTGDADARMTPAVRRLLREHELSPAQIPGTGAGGRITREDVLRFVEARRSGALQAPAAAQPVPAPPAAFPAALAATLAAPPRPAQATAHTVGSTLEDELVPFNQMRRGIAAQMVRAAAAPHAYLTFECDMSSVVRVRAGQRTAYQAREGINLSYVPFVVKAVAEALKKHPDINAHYTDQGLLRKRRVNVGIAVAVDNGLLVPVIHDADQLSLNGLNHAVNDLADRARAGRLRLDDLQGGTFTVDNTGAIGSISSQPIINVPEIVILTMEAIVRRPVVRTTPDGEVIAVRSMMNVCASFDHRATDGAQVGAFVGDVVRWLESVDEQTPIW